MDATILGIIFKHNINHKKKYFTFLRENITEVPLMKSMLIPIPITGKWNEITTLSLDEGISALELLTFGAI